MSGFSWARRDDGSENERSARAINMSATILILSMESGSAPLLLAFSVAQLRSSDQHRAAGPHILGTTETRTTPFFDLTPATEAASCRPAALKWRQFSLTALCKEAPPPSSGRSAT